MVMAGSKCYCDTGRARDNMARDEESRRTGAFTAREYVTIINAQSEEASRPRPGRESYQPGSSGGRYRPDRQGDAYYQDSGSSSWDRQKERMKDRLNPGRGTSSGHARTPAKFNSHDYYQDGHFYRADGRRPM